MFNHVSASVFKPPIIGWIAALVCFSANGLFAQSTDQLPPRPQHLTTQPAPPEIPPDLNSRPPRAVQRIGTAIPPPRNTVSIKSTDAGAIPRQSPLSGCINCGVVDFVNKMGQGAGLNAIVSGVVAGTIAREVIGHMPHPQGGYHPQSGHLTHPSYPAHPTQPTPPTHPHQVGITLDDGRQAVIAIPEGANFQQGDRVRWVDGVLVLDRPAEP